MEYKLCLIADFLKSRQSSFPFPWLSMMGYYYFFLLWFLPCRDFCKTLVFTNHRPMTYYKSFSTAAVLSPKETSGNITDLLSCCHGNLIWNTGIFFCAVSKDAIHCLLIKIVPQKRTDSPKKLAVTYIEALGAKW